MRTIVNISLPEHLAKEVGVRAKRLHCASKSEFFRLILREWLAKNLAQELETENKQIRAGKIKMKKMKTVKDIWAS